MKHVAIAGGGVIGLCTAYALVRRGCRVTVIDAGTPGQGCSKGNAGWITPSLSGPIPAPGLMRTSLKWMLRSDSPLYIKPRLSPDLLRWLLGFWLACNPASFDRGLAAVATLNARTMPLFDELRAEGVQFEMHNEGLIMAYLESHYIEHDRAGMEGLSPFGYDAARPLSGDELRDLEPALGDAVAGGYWISQERHVRPETLMSGLVDFLTARGVTFMADTTVQGIARQGRRVTAFETSRGVIQADDFLVCAGAWTPQVLRHVGVKLPIEGGKGYSMDFDTLHLASDTVPRHSLYLRESKVAVTPFDGKLRLAGTMELSGINADIAPRRIEAMLRAAGDYLRHPPATPGDTQAAIKNGAWSGLRPLAPDGLPVLGLVPGFGNLTVASGHAMLGITLGPATGEEMAELIVTGQGRAVLRAFDPARFVKRA